MRRNEVDSGSQPVRNLAYNPKNITVGSNVSLRQNLCAYPSMEGGTGTPTIRTNLCTDPRGIFNTSGYGTQTITPNVAITGHPLSITTAVRISYTATDTNPGLIFLNPLVSGTQYTASAWVYHETSGGGSQGLAQAGVASMPSPPAITTGAWNRISWTFTASGTSQVGFRVSANTGSGSFLVTGILVEASSALGNYFDGTTPGAGDFSYAWSGTANASTSIQKAVQGVAGWAVASQAGVFQSSLSPQFGSKCAGVATKGINGDGIFTTDIAVVAGAAYTWSAWIKITEAVPNLSASVRWKDSAQTILRDDNTAVHGLLVVGSWVRVSVTSVAPTGATLAQCMWRIFATHTGTTFYVDGVMFEQSPVLSPYFDGTTAAAGDFTYNWNGVGHASTSTQWAKPVTGTVFSRSSSGVSIDSKFFGYQTTLEDGAKGARFVAPVGTANSTWRIAGLNSVTGWDWSKIKAGGQYTLFFRWRSFGWAAASAVNVQISTGSGTNNVVNSLGITMNQTGWQEYRRTFTALRDADNTQWVYIALPTTPSAVTDGIFDIRDFGLYEGEYNGDLVTGTNSLSKWDGAADNSTSVGYPPQLLDLAGKPELDITTTTSFTLADDYGPAEARTFYTVFQNLQKITDTSVQVIGTYGASTFSDTVPNSFITLRQEAVSGAANLIKARRTGGGGPYNTGAVAVHVTCWGLKADGTLFVQTDNGTEMPDAAVMAVPHQKIQMAADGAYHKHYRTIMYRGAHSTATRAAVSRYLGNKYGAAVA